MLGGTQSLHTNSMDEALALPSDKAVRIALRTQQIIAEEFGVTNTVDPLGGSYFVEALTNEMERQCYDYFDRIEEYGGVIPAIKAHFFQSEIARASYEYQHEIDAGPQDDGGREQVRDRRADGDTDPGDGPQGRGEAAERSWPACGPSATRRAGRPPWRACGRQQWATRISCPR